MSKQTAAKQQPAGGQACTPKKGNKAGFLKAYPETCSISKAAELAGIARQSHYNWMATDADYKATFLQIQDQAAQTLEDEAVRRAHEGVKRPVYQGGKRVGFVQEYSDTLMIFLLKGMRPDKYRERSEVTHKGTVGIADVLRQRFEKRKNADAQPPKS